MGLTGTLCSPSGMTMSSSAATKLKSIPTLMFSTAAPKYLHTYAKKHLRTHDINMEWVVTTTTTLLYTHH